MLRLLSSGRDFWIEEEYHFDHFKKQDFNFARNHLIEEIECRKICLERHKRNISCLINHFATEWKRTVIPDIATYYYDILGEIDTHILDCENAIIEIKSVSDEQENRVYLIEMICDRIGDRYACKHEDIIKSASLESKRLFLTRAGYNLTVEERKALGLYMEGVNYES
jgi:hypothetical protein